ncbi:uroporphyrin-III C-methyltransferase [Thauera terpenica 58Eu]|jgi:uroporphyrin-III C-methyltransferase/precorrin-2 dehydrogenase/sirohydrochlorin ferrochelatase/uroporphyrin-III C-methyltransferase|uniref:uroporphyrinogen-III C-methyltransferase n=1 Tax=Thauera terpenica 58Eu TaxID=1348657 RepID=S9ZQ24_9RHOO|nr:uroporphyrinogen-III C-methyltransferase [Thauera terpenica]EPZ16711.1 uroporphyrin-III C-methyltransferase [Thauera terpenica 58Eu]
MSLPDLAVFRPGPVPGHVYLVGAGPGDPELLTLRGARLVAGADVVVYDNLVAPALLDLAPAAAERIYVGKKAADHSLPQEAINALLVRLAQAGKSVVRLKGGDPFIFGRGGEEMEDLLEAGITVEVVPGVTAAAGVAAYAGIPLTHRDHAHSVVFTTGFLKDGALDLDWPLLAHRGQTLVIYMGVSRLAEICAQLVAHGLPATTPVAVIERGTTHAQRIVKAELATLADEVLRAGIRPPSLTIVGDVVKLYPRLSWFQPEAPPAASPLPHAGCAVVHTSREP